MLTDNMAKIQIALKNKAIIRNEKGECIALPSNDGQRTEDCIKCYIKDAYYWSSAAIQKELFVNNKPFDEWFESQYSINTTPMINPPHTHE